MQQVATIMEKSLLKKIAWDLQDVFLHGSDFVAFWLHQEDLFESARIYIESSGRPFNYLPTEAEAGCYRVSSQGLLEIDREKP